jgi:hypothetical protein
MYLNTMLTINSLLFLYLACAWSKTGWQILIKIVYWIVFIANTLHLLMNLGFVVVR